MGGQVTCILGSHTGAGSFHYLLQPVLEYLLVNGCKIQLQLQSIIRAVNGKIQRAIDALWKQMVKHRNVAKGFANPVARDIHISPMHKRLYHFTLYQLQCLMLTARMTSSIAASTALEKLASLILLKLSPLCYRHSNTCSRIPASVRIRV